MLKSFRLFDIIYYYFTKHDFSYIAVNVSQQTLEVTPIACTILKGA